MDTTNNEKRKIVLNGISYSVIENPDGTMSLMRYNEKYKMWVKLDFLVSAKCKDVDRFFTGILTEQYLERVTNA